MKVKLIVRGECVQAEISQSKVIGYAKKINTGLKLSSSKYITGRERWSKALRQAWNMSKLLEVVKMSFPALHIQLIQTANRAFACQASDGIVYFIHRTLVVESEVQLMSSDILLRKDFIKNCNSKFLTDSNHTHISR